MARRSKAESATLSNQRYQAQVSLRSIKAEAKKLIDAVTRHAEELAAQGWGDSAFDNAPGVSTVDPFWFERMELREHGLALSVTSRDGKPVVRLSLKSEADREAQAVRLAQLGPTVLIEVDMKAPLVQRLEEFAIWMRALEATDRLAPRRSPRRDLETAAMLREYLLGHSWAEIGRRHNLSGRTPLRRVKRLYARLGESLDLNRVTAGPAPKADCDRCSTRRGLHLCPECPWLPYLARLDRDAGKQAHRIGRKSVQA